VNAVTLLRMVAELLAAVIGGCVALVQVGIGDKPHALTTCIVAGIIAWIVRPDAEARARFHEYQEQRARFSKRY
jgi:hypothetical protein